MIGEQEILRIGQTQKPHGLKGELVATIDCDYDFTPGSCVVLKIDGIPVPFFVESARRRNTESVLLTLEGIDSDREAASLALEDLYILKKDAEKGGLCNTEDDTDILYISDMPGWMLVDTKGGIIGTIERVDDSTLNTLLEVKRPSGDRILLPFSEDFVADVDTANKSMMLDLPTGLLDIN